MHTHHRSWDSITWKRFACGLLGGCNLEATRTELPLTRSLICNKNKMLYCENGRIIFGLIFFSFVFSYFNFIFYSQLKRECNAIILYQFWAINKIFLYPIRFLATVATLFSRQSSPQQNDEQKWIANVKYIQKNAYIKMWPNIKERLQICRYFFTKDWRNMYSIRSMSLHFVCCLFYVFGQ